ncbi:uncharacterized protein LOC134746912 [Cydia strobilella]|uniref:uncharacterized protein LOC134746912 n=1 Tax=Cydia strobilella TaxID=1100964 RepID=UPI003007E048
MPPKSRRRGGRLSLGSHGSTESVNENITMNQEALTTMLITLQQSQNEFCQQLLREVRSSTPSQADATAAAIAAAATFASVNGNFAQCTARYSGSKEEHLESFIDNMESYKSCMHITDENAVRGLSLLLTKDAGVWWQGVKSQVRTWEDALDKLRSAFGERRPPFVIYTELFSLVQGEQNTEIFVSKARALLAKLPPEDLSERVQIDMVFGLLDRRIRKRLKRENIDTFDTLLKHCQSIEDSRKENHVPVAAKKSSDRQSTTAASVSPNRARSRASDASGVATQRAADEVNASTSRASSPRSSDQADVKPRRLYCVYCRRGGHSKDNCERLEKSDKCVENKVVEEVNQVKCYGCGAPNVIRSKCPNCNSKSGLSFYSLDVVSCHVDDAANPRQGGSSGHDSSQHASPTPPYATKVRVRHGETPAIRLSEGPARAHECSRESDTYAAGDGIAARGAGDATVPGTTAAAPPANPSPAHCGGGNPTHAVGDFSYVQALFCNDENQSLFCNDDSQSLSCNNVSQTLFCNKNQVCGDKIDVCQVNVKASPRPIMILNILGARGSALVDPAAKASVAGHTLYAFLRSKGHPLVSSTMSVRLADGVSRNMTVLTAEVEVTLEHKTRKTSFVIFPDAVSNESLLGIDFLKDFGLIIDFRDDLWYFAENSKQKYGLQFENVSPPALCVAALEVLRENEATLLNAQQHELLAQLLPGNKDLFEPGGGPTPFAKHRIDTGDHAPIAAPPYRVTPAKEVMQAEIEKMLADVIKVSYDLRAVLDKESIVPQVTPYLRSLISSLSAVRDRVEAQQNRRKEHADESRQPGDVFDFGDSVLIKSLVLSNAAKNASAKFVPKRGGPYQVVKKCLNEIEVVHVAKTRVLCESMDVGVFMNSRGSL